MPSDDLDRLQGVEKLRSGLERSPFSEVETSRQRSLAASESSLHRDLSAETPRGGVQVPDAPLPVPRSSTAKDLQILPDCAY